MRRIGSSRIGAARVLARRVLGCVLVWMMAGFAAAECQVPKGIVTLTMMMEDARRGRLKGPVHMARLEEGVAWWRSQALTVEQLGLSSELEREVLERLVVEAEALLRVSGSRDPRLFGPVLAQSSAILRRLCGQGALTPPKPPPKPEPTAAVAEVAPPELALGSPGGGDGVVSGEADFVGSVANAGRLGGWLLAGIGAVVGLGVAYRWAFSLAYNRRSCRIDAMLEFGLDVVDGTVTILGLKGCRFVPVNAGARERLDELEPGDPVYVIVAGVRREGQIRRFDPGYVAIFFDDHLARAEQADILAASSIRPQYVPQRPWRHLAKKAKPAPKRDPALRGPLYGVMSDEEVAEILGEDVRQKAEAGDGAGTDEGGIVGDAEQSGVSDTGEEAQAEADDAGGGAPSGDTGDEPVAPSGDEGFGEDAQGTDGSEEALEETSQVGAEEAPVAGIEGVSDASDGLEDQDGAVDAGAGDATAEAGPEDGEARWDAGAGSQDGDEREAFVEAAGAEGLTGDDAGPDSEGGPEVSDVSQELSDASEIGSDASAAGEEGTGGHVSGAEAVSEEDLSRGEGGDPVGEGEADAESVVTGAEQGDGAELPAAGSGSQDVDDRAVPAGQAGQDGVAGGDAGSDDGNGGERSAIVGALEAGSDPGSDAPETEEAADASAGAEVAAGGFDVEDVSGADAAGGDLSAADAGLGDSIERPGIVEQEGLAVGDDGPDSRGGGEVTDIAAELDAYPGSGSDAPDTVVAVDLPADGKAVAKELDGASVSGAKGIGEGNFSNDGDAVGPKGDDRSPVREVGKDEEVEELADAIDGDGPLTAAEDGPGLADGGDGEAGGSDGGGLDDIAAGGQLGADARKGDRNPSAAVAEAGKVRVVAKEVSLDAGAEMAGVAKEGPAGGETAQGEA